MPGLVWGGSLRRRTTRIRVEEASVELAAPDAMAIVLLLMLLALAPLALELGGVGLAACLGLWLGAVATARLHLRVRPGSAHVVRTVLGVPWSIVRRDARYAAPEHPWLWRGFDVDELVVPPARGSEPSVVLLELGPQEADAALGDTLDREIRRVLRGERWAR